MKVTSLREPIQTGQEVHSKRDQDSRHSHSGRDHHQKRSDKNSESETHERSPEEAQRLVREFTQQMSDHGFVVDARESPGLILVLDRGGTELRRLTLEDLAHQSESFAPRGLTLGRLLDRKV